MMQSNAPYYFAQSPGIVNETLNTNIHVIEKLVEQERSGSAAMGFGPLHFAVSLGNLDIVKRLLDSGLVNKDSRDKDGNTPLIWAVTSDGSEEMLEALVDHGADINVQNYIGETALYIASARGLADKVEYLLENGARTQITNLDGATALHAACAGGHEYAVEVLIRFGAFLNAGDDEDDTPLHWAIRESQKEIIRMLVEAGCELNCVNSDGETPLALAIALEASNIVESLIGMGAQQQEVALPFAVNGGKVVGTGSPASSRNVNTRAVNVDRMDVEMKNLSVDNKVAPSMEDRVFNSQRNAVGVRSASFGSTPPALSFVF